MLQKRGVDKIKPQLLLIWSMRIKTITLAIQVE